MEEREDGTTLILTEAKSESKQAFSSLSQNSQRYEHTETTVTGDKKNHVFLFFIPKSLPNSLKA